MPTQRDSIISKAIEILLGNPQGVRYTDLQNLILDSLPGINPNSIGGVIWNLDTTFPEEVYKADRGLFRHVSFREPQPPERIVEPVVTTPGEPIQLREEDFYPSFAEYLQRDIEEVSKAIPLGGNKFKDKWGTPDVIGITKPMPTDIIKEETVIVSSEIKMGNSSAELITAFGQACAYKIFSHKVYVVIPKSSNPDDKSRIESLCLIFGMGLILFDNRNKENPQYEIRVRSTRHEPDMWYVNKFMKLLETDLFA
jgi:hypothetical protein